MPYTLKQRNALRAIAHGARLRVMKNVGQRKAKKMLSHGTRPAAKKLSQSGY